MDSLTPARRAEMQRLVEPQPEQKCRHLKPGETSCQMHNLHCGWPACAEPVLPPLKDVHGRMVELFPSLLSLLASEGEKVKKLEADYAKEYERAESLDAERYRLREDRDRLTKEVERLKGEMIQLRMDVPDAEEWRERAQKAEAEVARLRARWEALKAKVLQREAGHRQMVARNNANGVSSVADNCAQVTVQHIYSDMADLERTSS